ncbi:MAG TPA: hypothetical protein VFR71_06265 [Methyloceanibacter sp.]|nr:hypothetical protein [Methyloceanibacter sp.]
MPAAVVAGSALAAPAEECMIGDAALCLAAPNCWWDNQRRGCYPGEAPDQDPCNAHEREGLCNTSSLNCRWSEAAKQCESKQE